MKIKPTFLFFFAALLALATTSCNRINDAQNTSSEKSKDKLEENFKDTTTSTDLKKVDSADDFRSPDTIGFDAYLDTIDAGTEMMKNIHIKSIDDTIYFDVFEKFRQKDYVVSYDPEYLSHSEKVRLYQSLLQMLNECLRLDEEMRSVGMLSSRELLDDTELEMFMELRDSLKLHLDREQN